MGVRKVSSVKRMNVVERGWTREGNDLWLEFASPYAGNDAAVHDNLESIAAALFRFDVLNGFELRFVSQAVAVDAVGYVRELRAAADRLEAQLQARADWVAIAVADER